MTSRHGAGIDFENRLAASHLSQRCKRRFPVPRCAFVKILVPFVELGDQVKVSDDVSPGLFHYISQSSVIAFHIASIIAAKILFHDGGSDFFRIIHRQVPVPRFYIVQRPDDIVIGVVVSVAKIVSLDAHIDIDLPFIFLFQRQNLPAVLLCVSRTHTEIRIKRGVFVPGKSQRTKAQGDGTLHQSLRAVFSVAVISMGMQIYISLWI